jgi:hypothetical protein
MLKPVITEILVAKDLCEFRQALSVSKFLPELDSFRKEEIEKAFEDLAVNKEFNFTIDDLVIRIFRYASLSLDDV